MGHRIKIRVDRPYTKRCRGPAIIGVSGRNSSGAKESESQEGLLIIAGPEIGGSIKIMPTLGGEWLGKYADITRERLDIYKLRLRILS